MLGQQIKMNKEFKKTQPYFGEKKEKNWQLYVVESRYY